MRIFASRLHGECLFDSRETTGECFELFETFGVFLERLTPCTGAGSRNRVGSGDEHRINVVDANVIVVPECGMHDFGAFPVPFEEFGADRGVPSFHFVIGSLADVVQKTAAAGQVAVESELLRRAFR